jgi:D-methionine transport system permease protein
MDTLALIPLGKATFETLYMVFISGFISIILGALLGIWLFLTREKQPLQHRGLHHSLSFIVNVTRSVPFIILLISILPLTRLITGTTIGMNAAIVPLTLAAIPFYARICENALLEVPAGLLETAHAFGATTSQLVSKILIPESLPVLIRGMALTLIGLIGYSAMAGAVGGGGLGELAISYGYQRFNVWVTLETVVILVLIVQLVQFGGERLAKQRRIRPLLWTSIVLGLVCLSPQAFSLFSHSSAAATLRVGVMTGWSEEVMKTAQKAARDKYGLQIKIVGFDDYVLPNTALANGDIDANIFQHVPYLEAQNKAHGYHLVPIAKTFVYPMGFYSRKITRLSDLKRDSIIAIPNDPSNEARSLLLLQKAKLITLKTGIEEASAGIHDIDQNRLKLRFKLLDAAQLPRVLKDADLVVLTNDYVKPAGFNITQALLKEGSDSLYANVIVVNAKDKDNPLFKELVDAVHSKEFLAATEKQFPDGGAIAAW